MSYEPQSYDRDSSMHVERIVGGGKVPGDMAKRNSKIIFLVTEDWYFWSHRLPMARAAHEAGFDVGVATRVGNCGDSIRAEGFSLHELDWTRGSLSLLRLVRTVRDIVSIYRREKPDIVHHVSLKPVVSAASRRSW